MLPTLVFWLLVLAFAGAFAAQVATRIRLIAAADNNFSVDQFGFRVRRFLVDVVLQMRTIRERPVAGAAHAFVFWGFVAFSGYIVGEDDLIGRQRHFEPAREEDARCLAGRCRQSEASKSDCVRVGGTSALRSR